MRAAAGESAGQISRAATRATKATAKAATVDFPSKILFSYENRIYIAYYSKRHSHGIWAGITGRGRLVMHMVWSEVRNWSNPPHR